MRDLLSQQRLSVCHPELIRRVDDAADHLEQLSIFFRIACAMRSYAQSDADFAIGRTSPGTKITNARGGYSAHNFGFAVDCYPFQQGSNGQLNYDAGSAQFRTMVLVLKAHGLAWGGDWHSIVDPPHFQLAELPVTPTDADRACMASGGLQAVWNQYPALGTKPTVEIHASGHSGVVQWLLDALAGMSLWRAAWSATKVSWYAFRYRRLAGQFARRAHVALTTRAYPCDNLQPAIPPQPQTEDTAAMPTEDQKQPESTVDLEANALTDFLTKYVPSFFGKHVTADETKAAETAVIAFVGKDGLNLAVDAVKYAEAKFASVTTSTDATKAEKLATAKAQFLADASAAKKDLTTLGGAALNFVLEGALQVAIGEAAKVAAKLALNAEAETKA